MRLKLSPARAAATLALSAALLLAACDMGPAPAPSAVATPTLAAATATTAAEPSATEVTVEVQPTATTAQAEPTATEVVVEAQPTATTALAEPTATEAAAEVAPTATTETAAAAATPTTEAAGPASTCSGVLTQSQTEGPYYKAGSPENATLYQDGMAGTVLVITGYVYDASCNPVANAWIDFWQADANGQYDNSGYTLRGHQYTDANGQYTLTTVIPGEYPGRTPHIHVKVQAPNGPILTTQLYLPGEASNARDNIFDDSMVMQNVQQSDNRTTATFDFVINTGQ